MSVETEIVNAQPPRQIEMLVDMMSLAWERARLYQELAEQASQHGERAEALAIRLGLPLDEVIARVEERYCAVGLQ
jgi:GAF domain-containing protein